MQDFLITNFWYLIMELIFVIYKWQKIKLTFVFNCVAQNMADAIIKTRISPTFASVAS